MMTITKCPHNPERSSSRNVHIYQKKVLGPCPISNAPVLYYQLLHPLVAKTHSAMLYIPGTQFAPKKNFDDAKLALACNNGPNIQRDTTMGCIFFQFEWKMDAIFLNKNESSEPTTNRRSLCCH